MPQNDKTFEFGDLFADFFGGPRRRPAQIERLPVPEPTPEQPKQKQVQQPTANDRKSTNTTVVQGSNDRRYSTENVAIDQRSANNRDQRQNGQQAQRDNRDTRDRDGRDVPRVNTQPQKQANNQPRREEPEDYDDTTDNFFNRHR